MDTKSLGIINEKSPAEEAVELLNGAIGEYERLKPISFNSFLQLVENRPADMLRNVFQVFHDMMQSHVTVSEGSILDDDDALSLVDYDCSKLFEDDSENPYFADNLFANRLMKHMESLRHGTQQNRIYIFHGPHGCGKSTFLNNLLKKFESYANTEKGMRYEVVWRLDIEQLGGHGRAETATAIERLVELIEKSPDRANKTNEELTAQCVGPGFNASTIEIPCMSHDNPILIIPKSHRRRVLDKLIKNDEFKWRLFTEKQYDWVF